MLVDLRNKAELSRDDAAEQLEIARQTLWRYETGYNSEIKKMFIHALCALYRVGEDDRRQLLYLQEEVRKDGWWQSYGDAIFGNVELFIDLEQAARRVTTVQLTLLPGLVQTAAYRRAMAQVYHPPVAEDEIERHIELLTRRQARLDEPADRFTLVVLLSEAALRYPVGGPAVMEEQCRHLIELSQRPNVSIRIIPIGIGAHLGLQVGSFVLLEFPEHVNPKLSESPVVYVEGYTGALYLDKAGEIEKYQAACSILEGTALGERESRELLLDIAEEYRA
ncbi:helix-turn-helix domain-containing protein [Nocardia terpenica]|uniref:helix-turn-helix domain-containing protein n=1 Tax=Nocardia terpenica TaxID=455432 RepID=UPI002FE0ADBA